MSVNNDFKISYFFVGVGKCGTSWIYENVKTHALASVPLIKEPYIIDLPFSEQQSQIRKLYQNYENMADFSNTYYYDKDNPEKIFEHNPDARIIVTVRKPSDRIKSHFKFLNRHGSFVDQTLSDYLDADPEDIVARSDYDAMIGNYKRQFSAAQVLILPMELLKEDPQSYMNRLTEFMGVPNVLLSDADRKPVLQAKTARFPLVSRVLKLAARTLRKYRMLTLLGKLKQWRVLSAVLYTQQDRRVQEDQSFGNSQGRIDQLDENYEALLGADASA